MKPYLLTLVFGLLSFVCLGQNWLDSYKLSVDYYNNYQSEKAREYAEKALEGIKTASSAPTKNLTVILRQLSIVCYDLGDDLAALSYAKEEVETLITLGENQDMNYASALQNLAIIRSARSEYGAAEPLLKEALDIAFTYHTEETYEVAVAKGALAVAKFQLKKDDEARGLFESSIQVLNAYEEVGPEYYNIIYHYGALLAEQGDYAHALKYIQALEDYYNYETPNYEYGSILIKGGDALDQLGRFAEATEKYEKALENFKNLGQEDSEEYTIALNNLSIVLQKTGKFDQATAIVEELLNQKKPDDSISGSYLSTLTNYANLLIRKGEPLLAREKLEDAKDLYKALGLKKDKTYLNVLESLSAILAGGGEMAEATQLIDEGITIAESEAIGSRLYALYNQKAKILLKEAKYEAAKAVAQQALEKSVELVGESALQTAYIKNTLASIYAQLGKYAESEELYLAVLPVFKQTFGDDHPEYATVAVNYSSLLQLEGNYYRAESYLKIAEDIKRSAFGRENKDYLVTYENRALLYLNTGRYTEAAAVLEEIKRIKEKILPADDPSLAYTLSNLGSVKKQTAAYAEAEVYLKQATDIYESTYGSAHIYYASVINNLALLYQKMGNLDAAKPLFMRALEIYEKQIGRLNPDYATSLENLATIYQLEENYEKAKELLEEALEIDEQILGTNHPLYAKTLHNLASLYMKSQQMEDAKALYLKALEIDKNAFGTNHPSYANTLYNLAALEQEQEHYDQARTYYEEVVAIRKVALGENHPDYAFALYGLASIMHKTGDFEGAKPLYQAVTSQYLEFINKYFPALSESEKSAFYAKIKPIFDSYLDYATEYCLLQKGEAGDRQELVGSMYDLQLSTKALLLNATNKVRNAILGSGDEALISLFSEWLALKENIVKAYSMSKEELKRSRIDVSTLEKEANEMEKQLSLRSASFSGTFEQEKPTWQQVQASLSEGAVAVELIRIKKKMKTDSVLYLGLILPGTPGTVPELVVSGNGLQMEGKGFKTYKNSVIYKIQDTRSYELFWKPFDEKISRNTHTLFLSADGVINKVNISTLFDPEEKEYLIDRYHIRLLSNTRELIETKPADNQSNEAVMFGFPKYYLPNVPQSTHAFLFGEKDMQRSFGENIAELPGTLKELQEIEQIIKTKGWIYESFLEESASEGYIKQIISPKILHIATHGFFLEDIQLEDEEGGLTSRNAKFNPLLRSGLLLSGAENTVKKEDLPGQEDGILTAYEVMNLNLDHTELVVMSACETGLGEVKNGEGVYGLQRSFIVAGADNLVMSLWKVNDQTTQLLMSGFYQNWFGGQSRLEAFNSAIAEVRKEFKDPYYWGAFVMLGK